MFLRGSPGATVDTCHRARHGEPDGLPGLRLHRVDAPQRTGTARRGLGAHARRDIPLGRLHRFLEWPVASLRPRVRRGGPPFRCLGTAALPQFRAAEISAGLPYRAGRLDADRPHAYCRDINRAVERRSRFMVVARPDTGSAANRRLKLCGQCRRGTPRPGPAGASGYAPRADQGPGPDCHRSHHRGRHHRGDSGKRVSGRADAGRPQQHSQWRVPDGKRGGPGGAAGVPGRGGSACAAAPEYHRADRPDLGGR